MTIGEEFVTAPSVPSVPAVADLAPARRRRRRLDHVDAMRPIKQLGVVSTHSLLAFAPGGVTVGGALMLLHVSREAFLFVSACMLTYSYYDIDRSGLRTYWRKRLLAIGLPYLVWTLIYFFIGLPSFHGSPSAAAGRLLFLTVTGYSQLYFLVVLLQFYVLFPAVVWLLRRTERHHALLLGISTVVQLVYVSLLHWGDLPGFVSGNAGTREVFSYQLYLLAGCLAAVHYEKAHAWVTGHVAVIVASFVATATFAELWYWLGVDHVVRFFGSSSDAFQPIVVPFNIAAIALIYLIGVVLVRPGAPGIVKRLTRVGSDNSYAVYLSQVVFIDILSALGWRRLNHVVPWPIAVGAAVLVVFVAGCLLGGLVGRTRLAWPVVGRHQVSWSTMRPWFIRPARDDVTKRTEPARALHDPSGAPSDPRTAAR